MVLSNVIPALIDLSCHFEESENPRALALPLLKSLRQRFATIFDSRDPEFDAIAAAAACFLDPTVAVTIMTPDTEPLLKAAQQFIRQTLAAEVWLLQLQIYQMRTIILCSGLCYPSTHRTLLS